MISKTIGFRDTLFSDTPICTLCMYICNYIHRLSHIQTYFTVNMDIIRYNMTWRYSLDEQGLKRPSRAFLRGEIVTSPASVSNASRHHGRIRRFWSQSHHGSAGQSRYGCCSFHQIQQNLRGTMRDIPLISLNIYTCIYIYIFVK